MKAADQPVCILYKSLATALLLETMEVQIQFFSRPQRVSLSNKDSEKE